MSLNIIIQICIMFFSFGCLSNSSEKSKIPTSRNIEQSTTTEDTTYEEHKELPYVEEFSRESVKLRLKEKITKQEPLIIHVFVPLCDNKHQGIVPVNEALGDGLNPKSNLYWGALYGIKTFFKKKKSWKLEKAYNPQKETILERVVFTKTYSNTKVIMIADAYRGDKMAECLADYMSALSGKLTDSIEYNENILGIAKKADLLVFNGHNGLMDTPCKIQQNTDSVYRDAVVIACISHNFFKHHLKYAGGYPLVTTTNFLAPEGYILTEIFDAWAQMKSDEEIRMAAARGCNTYQKCGMKAANRLFYTGW